MEMKTDFNTFKSGDTVKIRKGFPYIDHGLLSEEYYVIDKMLDVAGVVTLKGQQWNRTFPDDAFELYNGDLSGKEQ